jgi:hypothetical protein
MRVLIPVFLLALLVSGCAGQTTGRDRCAQLLDAAWKDLDLAKAQGFAGTVSYGKALGLLTRSKANQSVEDFKECSSTAERAHFYISESRKGR